MKIKFSVNEILQYLLSLCMILNFETVWNWTNYGNKFRILVFLISVLTLFLLILLDYKKNNRKVLKKECMTLFLLFLYLSIFNLLNLNNIKGTIQISILIILFYIYFYDYIQIKKFMSKFINVVFTISVISLFFFVFSNLLNIIGTNDKILIYVNNVPKYCDNFFNLHYLIQKESTLGFQLYRNTSIFYEAPKFSLIVSIAFMYSLLFEEKKSYIKIIVFILTIITSFSLIGIFSIVIFYVLYIILNDSKKTKKSFLKKMFIFLLLILISIPAYKFACNILEIKSSTSSYLTRLDNYQAGIKAWKENPLFGSGYEDMSIIKKYYSEFRKNDIGYTISLLRVMAQGGIYLLLLYFIPIFKCIIFSLNNKKYYALVFSLFFIFLFVTNSFCYNYLTLFLLIFFDRISKKENIND